MGVVANAHGELGRLAHLSFIPLVAGLLTTRANAHSAIREERDLQSNTAQAERLRPHQAPHFPLCQVRHAFGVAAACNAL